MSITTPMTPSGTRGEGGAFFEMRFRHTICTLSREPNIAEYQQRGAKRVVRCWWGFEPTVHRPIHLEPGDRERFGGDAGFIGHYELPRARSLHALADSGVSVRVWGPGWEQHRLLHRNLKIENQNLANDDYTKAICGFSINLGFLRKANRDLCTQRTMEIPACGGFLLAERTAEHEALFAEGREAEYFGSDAELIEKVGIYLANPVMRTQIADRGRQACWSRGYSNDSRLMQMLLAVRDVEKSSATVVNR